MPALRLISAERECNKPDDSRGVAAHVTQFLQPLPHIRTAKKEEVFVEYNATHFKQ